MTGEPQSEKLKDFWWRVKRNRALIAVLVVFGLAILTVALGVGLWLTGRLPWQASTVAESTNTNVPVVVDTTPTPRAIDGITVNGDASNLLPTAVMVENLVDIRPQSGLGSASLVYEALVEGGITRFLAVYASDEATDPIGPIRSARSYFVDWAEEYGGIYAYVGGSPEALGVTNTSNYITDLNQFFHSQYYYRDDAKQAPHNLFSRSALFEQAKTDLELGNVGTYTPYAFNESPATGDAPAPTISIDYSNEDYQVEWRYDTAQQEYLRWDGGQPHIDANTGQQLFAKNVVVQVVPTQIADVPTGRLAMETIGTGNAVLFQAGIAINGEWKKMGRGDRTLFDYPDGSHWQFLPGTTWIQVVSQDTNVTY